MEVDRHNVQSQAIPRRRIAEKKLERNSITVGAIPAGVLLSTRTRPGPPYRHSFYSLMTSTFTPALRFPEARLCLDTMLSIARTSIRISSGLCLGLSKCHTTGYKVGHQVNWLVRRPFIACVLYSSPSSCCSRQLIHQP